MFVAKGSIVKIRLSPLKFNKTLDAALQLAMRQAIRAWMAAVIRNVPVYSGMARGSLRAVKKIPGLGNIAVPIRPTRKALERVGNRTSQGLANATATLTSKRFLYEFSFSANVDHYALNEFYDMKKQIPNLRRATPWGSLDRGAEAFFNRLHKTLTDKFPKIVDLATLSRVIIRPF